MHGVWRLRQLARCLAPKAIILLYHRVAEVASDPQQLCVTPQHFAEQLDLLHRNYYPLSLQSLRRRMRFNLWWPNSVVVTFDDGYADNLHQAKPLLERFDVPATVFVVAGQVGEAQEFWWDDLARIFLSAPMLPGVLELKIAGRPYTWHLDTAEKPTAAYESSGRISVQPWHVLMKTDPSPRHTAYREIALLLRNLDGPNRERILNELAGWAELERVGRQEYATIDIDGLQALARSGLVEVGAHTMTHPVLSALPLERQWEEIITSKERLEEASNQPVTSFSYPFGGRSDYTAETVRLVKEAGFTIVCSNFPGHIQWGTDPYQLPRYLVRDWNGEDFDRRLDEWFHE